MKFIYTLLLLCAGAFGAFAQQNPVQWKFSAKKAKKGEYVVTLEAKIEGAWAIYSQFLPSEDGPVATTLAFKNAELLGKAEEVSEHRIEGHDAVFDMKLTKYKKQVQFVQRVKAAKGTKITGTINYMTCNDDTCLPPRDVPFEVVVK